MASASMEQSAEKMNIIPLQSVTTIILRSKRRRRYTSIQGTHLLIWLKSILFSFGIRCLFTIHNCSSESTTESQQYIEPFSLTETQTVWLKPIFPTGGAGRSYKTTNIKQNPKSAPELEKPGPGLQLFYTDKAYHFVEGFQFDEHGSVKRRQPDSLAVLDFIVQLPIFGLKYTGSIKVTSERNYTFYTSTDDRCRLYVDNQLVVDTDEPQPKVEKTMVKLVLETGYHATELKFIELSGGFALNVL